MLCTSVLAFSQSGSSEYRQVLSLLKDKGYSISTEQVADLKQGETAYHFKTFYKNLDYVIVAMSDDDDVTDVDVYLYEEDGDEYTKDTDTKNVAVVKMSPLLTRDMKVVIKNYASNSPNYASKCRFVIAYK
jgi:hypothetical protein